MFLSQYMMQQVTIRNVCHIDQINQNNAVNKLRNSLFAPLLHIAAVNKDWEKQKYQTTKPANFVFILPELECKRLSY